MGLREAAGVGAPSAPAWAGIVAYADEVDATGPELTAMSPSTAVPPVHLRLPRHPAVRDEVTY